MTSDRITLRTPVSKPSRSGKKPECSKASLMRHPPGHWKSQNIALQHFKANPAKSHWDGHGLSESFIFMEGVSTLCLLSADFKSRAKKWPSVRIVLGYNVGFCRETNMRPWPGVSSASFWNASS